MAVINGFWDLKRAAFQGKMKVSLFSTSLNRVWEVKHDSLQKTTDISSEEKVTFAHFVATCAEGERGEVTLIDNELDEAHASKQSGVVQKFLKKLNETLTHNKNMEPVALESTGTRR